MNRMLTTFLCVLSMVSVFLCFDEVLANTTQMLMASCEPAHDSTAQGQSTDSPSEVIITFDRGTSMERILHLLSLLDVKMEDIALNRIVRARPVPGRTIPQLKSEAANYREILAVEPNYGVKTQ